MARSDSLRRLTSAMTRLENAYRVVEDLPPADRQRVLDWAEEELHRPLGQALIESSKGK
jgi:hypothetical protein